MLILKMAVRYLLRHWEKNIIIGFIIFIGSLIIIIGNAFIRGTDINLKNNLQERFIGDVLIAPLAEKKENFFFSSSTESIQVLKDFDRIKQVLENQKFIKALLPFNVGSFMLMNENGPPGFLIMIGVDFAAYQQMFDDNIGIMEGRPLLPGERGILITHNVREQLNNALDIWVVPENVSLADSLAGREEELASKEIKRDFVLLGMSESAFDRDIRLPIRGIFKFKNLNTLWQGYSFMDLESFRECYGYVTARDKQTEIPEEYKTLFATDTVEDLLNQNDLFSSLTTSLDSLVPEAAAGFSATPLDTDLGAFNLISVRFSDDISFAAGFSRLEQLINETGLEIKLVTWRKAVGQIADLAVMIRGGLLFFIFFIFFIAAIVIMNTMSIAATDRTTEIGMMRAIGTQKNFIRKLFLTETSLLVSIFGIIGLAVGGLVIIVLSVLNIQAGDNEIVNLLFGGDTLRLVIDLPGISLGICEMIFIVGVAMLYPLRLAGKVTPLQSVARQ